MKKAKRKQHHALKKVKALQAEIEVMKMDRAKLFGAIYRLAAMFAGVVDASEDLRDMLTSLPGYNGGFPQSSKCKAVDAAAVNRSGAQ